MFLLSVLLLSTSARAAMTAQCCLALVDDLGYMDIRANNPDTFYETPNVDALARDGMRFTDGYAANPVCSPTRYSIMTGEVPVASRRDELLLGTREGRFKPAR